MNFFAQNNKKYIIAIIFGVLLLLFSGGDKKTGVSDEKKFEKMISALEGVENPQVMVTYKKDKEVMGVIVVNKRKLSVTAASKISQAAQAVFNAAPHKIVILP